MRAPSRRPVRRTVSSAAPVALAACLAALAVAPPPAAAVTRLDLSDRFEIDGLTREWAADESLLQTNDSDPTNPVPEESISDSKWGFNNDVRQIRLTWDARFLYVGVDAIIWDNNVILLMDFKPGGMQEMTGLNSWRRNFVFQGIQPDLFLATWDRNTLPQVWSVESSNNVTQKDATSFATVATFSQGTDGRAMEAAIPWTFLLGDDAELVYSSAHGDSVYELPGDISEIRLVAVVTAGPDGTGGPDSAPDNSRGHDNSSTTQVTIDNWVTVPFDLTRPGGGAPDGVPDFNANVRERVSFRVRPPVRSLRQEIGDIVIARPLISPEQGGELEFRVELTPEAPPEEDFRVATLTSEIYDLRGEKVRTLYRLDARSASDPLDPAMDRWDGRDDGGRLVPGGIYVLRVVLEPDADRKTRSFTVLR